MTETTITPAATTLIEAKYGYSNGSSSGNNWYKFVIKMLEMVPESNDRGKRFSFTSGAIEAPNNKVFTVWSSGDYQHSRFWICAVDTSAAPQEIKDRNELFIRGQFVILAQAESDTLAPRLLGWWETAITAKVAESKASVAAGGKATYTWTWQRKMGLHLATQITRRGVKIPAPLPE